MDVVVVIFHQKFPKLFLYNENIIRKHHKTHGVWQFKKLNGFITEIVEAAACKKGDTPQISYQGRLQAHLSDATTATNAPSQLILRTY